MRAARAAGSGPERGAPPPVKAAKPRRQEPVGHRHCPRLQDDESSSQVWPGLSLPLADRGDSLPWSPEGRARWSQSLCHNNLNVTAMGSLFIYLVSIYLFQSTRSIDLSSISVHLIDLFYYNPPNLSPSSVHLIYHLFQSTQLINRSIYHLFQST